MRVHSAVLAGVLCLFAAVASADITRISPSTFDVGGEEFITIFGSGLLGTVETQVVFDNLYVIEPSDGTSSQLVVFIPPPVMQETGQHSIVVRSVDAAGVRTHGPVFFTVTAPEVETGPPLLSLPENVQGEATDSHGGVVEFDVAAYDAAGSVPVTCTPPSGSTFVLGSTTVVCSATNTSGTSTGRFTVFVGDTVPPVVTVPANIVTDNPVVTFTASAVDNVDGTLTVSCSPASGSTFPQGTTRVRCSAVDAHANLGIGTFSVIVTGGPPQLILPDDILEEATGPAGAVVTFAASTEEGSPVTCTPASGSTFPLGNTVVTCSSTNTAGTSTGSFNVKITDTTPPAFTAPASVTEEATSAAGAVVVYVVTAHDLVDGDVAVSCTPASGSQFPMGDTEVLCSATDSRFNADTIGFVVRVRDTTPPAVVSISASPSYLWPPNHIMVPVTVSTVLADAVDPSPTWHIIAVSSNQPINGLGDGDAAPDWNITGPTTVELRSERAMGIVRTYTITIETRDATGNTGTATVEVRVTKGKPTAIH